MDAHDRKSISLFISTGCPRQDRVIDEGRRSVRYRECGSSDGREAMQQRGPHDLESQPVTTLRVRRFPAVIRTMVAARVSSR